MIILVVARDELWRNHNPKCWWKKVGVYIIFFSLLLLLWTDMLGKLCAPLPQLSAAIQRCRMIKNVVEIYYLYCERLSNMCIGDLYVISDYFYIYSVQAVVTVK